VIQRCRQSYVRTAPAAAGGGATYDFDTDSDADTLFQISPPMPGAGQKVFGYMRI
jgi:hypothetical protein